MEPAKLKPVDVVSRSVLLKTKTLESSKQAVCEIDKRITTLGKEIEASAHYKPTGLRGLFKRARPESKQKASLNIQEEAADSPEKIREKQQEVSKLKLQKKEIVALQGALQKTKVDQPEQDKIKVKDIKKIQDLSKKFLMEMRKLEGSSILEELVNGGKSDSLSPKIRQLKAAITQCDTEIVKIEMMARLKFLNSQYKKSKTALHEKSKTALPKALLSTSYIPSSSLSQEQQMSETQWLIEQMRPQITISAINRIGELGKKIVNLKSEPLLTAARELNQIEDSYEIMNNTLSLLDNSVAEFNKLSKSISRKVFKENSDEKYFNNNVSKIKKVIYEVQILVQLGGDAPTLAQTLKFNKSVEDLCSKIEQLKTEFNNENKTERIIPSKFESSQLDVHQKTATDKQYSNFRKGYEALFKEKRSAEFGKSAHELVLAPIEGELAVFAWKLERDKANIDKLLKKAKTKVEFNMIKKLDQQLEIDIKMALNHVTAIQAHNSAWGNCENAIKKFIKTKTTEIDDANARELAVRAIREILLSKFNKNLDLNGLQKITSELNSLLEPQEGGQTIMGRWLIAENDFNAMRSKMLTQNEATTEEKSKEFNRASEEFIQAKAALDQKLIQSCSAEEWLAYITDIENLSLKK